MGWPSYVRIDIECSKFEFFNLISQSRIYFLCGLLTTTRYIRHKKKKEEDKLQWCNVNITWSNSFLLIEKGFDEPATDKNCEPKEAFYSS